MKDYTIRIEQLPTNKAAVAVMKAIKAQYGRKLYKSIDRGRDPRKPLDYGLTVVPLDPGNAPVQPYHVFKPVEDIITATLSKAGVQFYIVMHGDTFPMGCYEILCLGWMSVYRHIVVAQSKFVLPYQY